MVALVSAKGSEGWFIQNAADGDTTAEIGRKDRVKVGRV